MKKYICLFWTLFIFSAQTFAATIEQTFQVEIGVFDAASVSFSYRLNPEDYSFSSQIKTSGLFDSFYSFQADYFTSGIVQNNIFITQKDTQKTVTSSHTRTKSLLFNDNGIPTRRISSKDGKSKEVDITLPSEKIDAFDIQTVLTMLIKNFQQKHSCDIHKTVFNGKKIYHITVKDSGRILFKDKKVPLSGEAYQCSAFIHQENAEKGDLLWQVSAERSIKFYLMTDKETSLPFPVKMEIASTPLGKLEAYMTDLNIKE